MVTALPQRIEDELTGSNPVDQAFVRTLRVIQLGADGLRQAISGAAQKNRKLFRSQSALEFTSRFISQLLVLPESTVTDNIARVRGTTQTGAHVFLLGICAKGVGAIGRKCRRETEAQLTNALRTSESEFIRASTQLWRFSPAERRALETKIRRRVR